MRILQSLLLLALFAGTVFAQEAKFPSMSHLDENDTFRGARLTPSEKEQVFEEVAGISFDTPDSWESELRVRRVILGGVEEGLVVQGTALLCGGTGNCETFVLRHVNSRWVAMFDEQAPIASGFGFGPESSNGIKNFVIAANQSAEMEKYTVYKFDGKLYRAGQCYEKSNAQIKTVPCK
jgi:hypothetical protein